MVNRRYLNVEVNLGSSVSHIKRWIDWCSDSRRTISYYMQKLNPTKVQAIVDKAAKSALRERGVRINAPRMQSILQGFYVNKTRNGDSTRVLVGHEYNDGQDETFSWTSDRGKVFEVKGSRLLAILEDGRGPYTIHPISSKRNAKLKWNYGASSTGHASNKGKDGNFYANQVRIPKMEGMLFLNRVKTEVNEYSNKIFDKLRDAVKIRRSKGLNVI